MEGQQETKRRGSKGAGIMGPTPVRRRSARHMAQHSEKQETVVFSPSDPYSAAMDDMPLKDLFPNMKVRKRSQNKKVEVTEIPSPKNTESEESVRSKLRDSLAAALKKIDGAEWDQERGQDLKSENEMGDQGDGELKPPETETAMTQEEARKDKCEAVPKEENKGLTESGEAPTKRIKLEVERVKIEDANNQSEASELAERVALDIESELYRHFGGLNRKYKEKARSLLFNLKDRSNPELRSRVLAGEITPENLCSMNAEQLASKELSEWRMAKAEEFAHMVVLTDADAEQPRLVKKTHKGEIEVQVEKDDILTEVVTVGSQQRFALATQQETEETGANVAADSSMVDHDSDDVVIEAEAEDPGFSPIRELNLTVGISAAADLDNANMMVETGEEVDEALQQDESASLPAILSLDEFVGSKTAKEPKIPIKGDGLDLKLGLNDIKPQVTGTHIDTVFSPSPLSLKDRVPRKAVGSPNRKLESGSTKNGAVLQKEKKKECRVYEKLWEGSFQLSGCQISPVFAFYKSGDGMELQSWSKLIEIKGRVRLDALEKFLQELRLSRTRAVMIIACRGDEAQADHGASVNALKEAANLYQRGERVGYAEPVPGHELYLFPGGGSSLKLLVEYGYLNSDQISDQEEGILIGFVVYRRSIIPMNASHKSSSHYFNANRHALSAQLDSPTRPNEIQWAGNAVGTSRPPPFPLPSSKESENHSMSLSFVNLQGVSVPNSSVEGGAQMAANSSKSSSMQQMAHNPGESDSVQLSQQLRSGKVGSGWLRRDVVKDEDADDDLPPGFGPRAMAMAKLSNIEDDDDDLPEYDFSAQSPAPIFSNANVVLQHHHQPQPQPLPSSLHAPSTQGPILNSLPQTSLQPETSILFEQLNPSGHAELPRPIISHIRGPLEQVRPPIPLHFHGAGPRPPPGPPPGPPPFGAFPLRPDGPFAARLPSAVQMPASNVMHTERNRPSPPQVLGDTVRPENVTGVNNEQRVRSTATLSQSHSNSHASKGHGQRRVTSQASNLWDDDDMPEWCPPALTQPENQPRPLPPPPRGMIPPLMAGGGWQASPLPPTVPLQGEGRGILQAPPQAMRYPAPRGGIFPMTRPEKLTADRGHSGRRPGEMRGFKSGK